MALNGSGPISIAGTTAGQSIQIELGGNGTTTMSLNDAAVRALAGVPSGAIIMPTNFYGKANQFAFNITTNQTNANLATLATNAGWNGTSKVVATLNSNVYISSTSTGTPALTIPNSFPNGVELVNNGFIMGMGGAGGNHSWGSVNVTNGAAGGTAIDLLRPATITNTSGYIGGGGGGGGTSLGPFFVATGGGGAGGGAGGNSLNGGGSGGAVGSPGNTGGSSWLVGCGGGGGRIMPGNSGPGATSNQAGVGAPGGQAGGGGGARAGQPGDEGNYDVGDAGGGGGGYGASGGNGRTGQGNPTTGGAGGGAGNAGQTVGGGVPSRPSSGGGGGKGVNLNGNSVTWVGGAASTGRVYGAIS